jgi:hypothetical protein
LKLIEPFDFVKLYGIKGAKTMFDHVEKNVRDHAKQIAPGKNYSAIGWVTLTVANRDTGVEEDHHFSVGTHYNAATDKVSIEEVYTMVPGEDDALDQINQFKPTHFSRHEGDKPVDVTHIFK